MAEKSNLFNLRLSPDYRLRLRAIAAHKGLDTEATCVRWLIAEMWEKLKGDIGQPPAPAASLEPGGLVYESVEEAGQ